jgi:hypothetical protein
VGAAFEAVAARHAAADTLSVIFQRRDRRLIGWIYGVFAVAFLLYGMIDWVPALVAFHVLSVPVIWLLVRRGRRGKIEDRFLDYRALAEGLRVLAFWTLAGIPERVSASYLSKHAGIVSWIRLAIRSVEVLTGAPEAGAPGDGRGGARELVRAGWVEAQHAYFGARKARMARWSRVTGAGVAVAFGLTFVVASVYLAFALAEAVPGWRPVYRAFGAAGLGHDDFQAALGIVAALGVAIEAYRKRRAFAELARQYAAAEQLFATARARLADPAWSPEVVFAAIGKEALLENGEWLWLHRTQPLEIPRG